MDIMQVPILTPEKITDYIFKCMDLRSDPVHSVLREAAVRTRPCPWSSPWKGKITAGGSAGARSEDGKKCTTFDNTPGWMTDDDGNGSFAYQVQLYVDGNEGEPLVVKDSAGNDITIDGNDTLYLKFSDRASYASTDPDAVKMNERVTIIYWR